MAKETVVLYPSPGKGHLVSMVELGKTLLDHHHPPPFSVTVILSVPPEEAEFTAAYVSSVSISHPAVSFQHLPVSFIPFDSSSPSNFIISTYEFTRGNSLALHASLSKSGDSTIRALVLDFFCTAACQVGASLNIPVSAIKALRDGLCVTDGHTPPLYCVGPLVATARNNNDEDRFLWVVRVPPQNDEAWRAISEPNPGIGLFLPDGFVERTKERGFVVESWVPQVAVLNHSSVGGFVTHCGWNSVLEAVCAGVPMLAWPLYAEQKLNCNYLVEEVRVALPLEERVTELMSSEKGEAVRERVFAMKEEAAEALREGGSSHSALAELFLAIKQGPGVEPRPSDPVEPSGRFGSSNSVAIPSET
ncbi:hypothetical protein CRG98_016152 [Punica granatum]|uniref:Uncharacterized protein n=1 Tax=Punica granatum TaxID=22663 RepID=A0A2I0K4L2_PUNGR|nr:hypothetical protein CRG98_016152 [Punica granatum]